MKSTVALLTVMALMPLSQADQLVLDCRQPKNRGEQIVCTKASQSSCKSTAALAVSLLKGIDVVNPVKVKSVTEIQEDASYDVKYVYVRSPYEIIYSYKVYVSTNAHTCHLAFIEN